MAYEIIGTVYKLGTPENIQTQTGRTIVRQSLTIMQRRFDPNTGEPFDPNYPTFEFANNEDVRKYKAGDAVRIRFDLNGRKYNDKTTGEEKYFTTIRAFRIEPYVRPQMQQQPIQPQPMQPQPMQQQPQRQAYQQQAYQPQYQQPVDDGLPF